MIEARTANDDVATNGDGRAERDGAVVPQASAKDRTLWWKIVVALRPTGDEED